MRTRVPWILAAWMSLVLAAAGELTLVDVPVPDAVPNAGKPPAVVPAAGAAGSTDDTLVFMNRDALHGHLLAVSPDGFGLRWKHPGVEKVIDFSMKSVSDVKLSDQGRKPGTAFNTSVRLTNGDLLAGDLVSLDSETLILDTWYSGKIQIQKVMVSKINPSAQSSSLLYEGPNSLEEWTFNRHSSRRPWTYRKGGLYANYSYPIGRFLDELPDMINFQFDAAWRSYAQFYFNFCTDNIQSSSGDCYSLRVSGSSIYLYRYSPRQGSRSLGNANVSTFSNSSGSRATINVLVDRKKKSIHLLVDGQQIKEWTDNQEFAKGNGILFQPQSRGDLKITKIRVSTWDGEPPKAASAASAKKEDMIRFVNSDKVSGKVLAITDGTVSFKTSYAEMSIPIQRVVEILLSDEQAERARRNKGDVRASFAEKGLITLELDRLESGTLHGSSENFGPITLPMQAFRQIEFNIYDEKDDDDEMF